MSVAVAITLFIVVFGFGVLAGFEVACQVYKREIEEIEERVRELRWLRGHLADREHPA